MKKNGGDDFATECHVQCDYVSNRGYIRVAHNVHRRITMHTHTMRAYCVSSPIEESPVSGASYACTLCGYTLLLFGGGRWNARGMLLKSIEAHSSSSFLIIPLYIGLIAQTFAPSLSPRFGRLGFFSRTRLYSNPLTEEKENVVVRITDKKNRTEKKWRGRERTKRERLVYFAGQTHIPGLARVPALPRVPGLTRGTFPDAPSPFTPYLRDSEPYRRNKHHVGNNVTANSVSGACTNPNNTDPTASPASSAHLGPNSGSSAHQDCYKHSPQHGGELIRLASFREILFEIEESNLNQFSGKSIRFDSVVRSRRIVVPCFVFDSDSGYRRVTTMLRSRAASYPRGSWSGCETTRKPHPPPSPGSRGGEARMARDLEGEGGREGSAVSRGNSFIPRSGSAPSNST